MQWDDDGRQRSRQELLEVLLSGMEGSACAPMPGIMLEMLEIAAMERGFATARDRGVRPVAEATHLTLRQKGSRMAGYLLKMGTSVIDVARGFTGPWRLSA